MALTGITAMSKDSLKMVFSVQYPSSTCISRVPISNSDQSRPPVGTITPFSRISNSTEDAQQLEQAMRRPEIVVVSDWSHFTSIELQDIYTKANIDFV